jgi:phage shock protein A
MEGPSHPIAKVAKKAAQLSHILELQIESPLSPASLDNAFSASTSNALRRCATFPATETMDGRPVVDSGSYLKAVLGAAEYEHKTESEALAEAIAGSNTDRLAPFRDKIGGSDRSDPTGDELARCIASPDLTEMLAEAARLASQVSSGQVRVDWRHALVACLKQLPAQQAIWTEGLSTETLPDAVFSQIRSTLTEILTSTGAPDDPRLWDPEIDAVQPHSDLRLPEPERRSDTHYVRDDPVRTLTEDRLGLASEVRALAEVICLREPGPPLAIGLFGDWGSGKSTYMNLVESAIDELTRRTTSDQQARELFVEGVVHIKFNAWHYNDADLWSSLTSEFFRQLRVGGHSGRARDDYSALVRQVAERVATAEAAADQESKDLETKRSAASDLRRRLAELERQDAALRDETLLATARAEVALLPEKDKQQLCGLLGHLIPPEDRERAQEALLSLEVERLLGAYGTASVTWRGLLNALSGRGSAASRPVYLWLAGGLVLVAVWIALQYRFPEVFGAGVAVLLGLLSALGGAARAVLSVYKTLEPVFRTANTVALKLEEKKQAIDLERREKQEELAELEGQIAEIAEKRQALLADAARFRAAGPEQVLDFFLRESETTRAFEGSLGVVSRVRRAFEQLDAIFREAHDAPKARPPKAGFDRIVLYIDDLDRCRSKQVVEVLEAVHLLLAFPLFVVIVGVDARWLEQSLLEFYKDKLSDTNTASSSADAVAGRRENVLSSGQATVHDFLEKIFQIPVRLRHLSAVPEPDYANYIREVAGPISSDALQSADGPQETGGEGRTEIHPLEVEIRPVARPAGAEAQHVRLTMPEIETIRRLGPIAGKTPRAVKRFVNLYRLVRGLRRGPDLDDFLETGDVRPYAAYQFWLAVDVGLPLHQARRLRTVVGQLDTSVGTPALLLEPLEPGRKTVPGLKPEPAPDDKPAHWDGLAAFWTVVPQASRGAIRDAVNSVVAALPGNAGLQVLRQALEDTRRFSSDRYVM